MPNKKRKDVASKKPIARTNSTTSNKNEKKPVGKNATNNATKTTIEKSKTDQAEKRKQTTATNNVKKLEKKQKNEKKLPPVEVDETVEIRNDPNRTNVGEAKRYSDSFIVGGCGKVDSDCVTADGSLSRSRSGILTDFDAEKDYVEKSERKTRRFSDIFRYGTLRSAESVERMHVEIVDAQLGKKKLVGANSDSKKKSKIAVNSKLATRNPSIRSEKLNSENNSYLKRVKSKICRTKNESEAIIYENEENLKTKKEPSVRGSVSNFDLLIRQTSNLERGRIGMFGHKKCASNVGIGETTTSEKPVLAKSKSSSAINLNLLRTRRNKLMEQLRSRNSKPADDEFAYVPFSVSSGHHHQLCRNLSVDLITEDTVDHAVVADETAGDMKASHSLTRTDSDRRPDAKTDTPAQDGQDHGQNHEEDATNIESTKSLPPAQSDKKKNSSSINRSESVKESSEKQKKQRRNFSDPLRPHNIGDSANLDTAAFWSGSTGSSSNSSINSNSRCSNDSPSMGNTGCDSDGINEADLNDWQSGLTPEEQHRIPPHEKQRQEIINELLSTEISHVRNLGILDRVFLRGIKERGLLKEDELQLIFPNLPEVKKIHSNFAKLLRAKKTSDGALWKDIGEILLEMFNGTLGESFQKAAATFCEKQQVALDLIKEKRRKDPKFSVGLNELEQNRECRRLPLQGFILTEMQRLSKYPLIIERLIGTIEKNANEQDGVEYSDAELGNLTLAAERAREIINHVNEAAKRAWGKLRLQEIQSHLDTTQFTASKDFAIVNEFKTIDLTTYTLLHEGLVQLKRQNKVHQPLHMLLLEEAVIFLVKDGDQRFVLKFFQCGKPGQPLLPPIIKISSTLIFRPNAATDCSLFLVNTSTQNSNMYELLTKDNSERKTWIMHLSKALEPFSARDGKAKNPTEPSSEGEETVADLPNIGDVAERAETIGGVEAAPGETEEPQNSESGNEDKPASSAENEDTSSDNDTVGGGVSTKFTADDWPLIQPSEVHANIPPVHYADAVLTPIEQLNRKNDEVRKALEDREKLVADIFNIPRDDYHHIMDMANEESKNETEVVSKEPTELVLTSLYQLDQLLKAVNESYVVTDADEVLLKSGGKGQSCASNPNHAKKEFIPQAASIIHGVQGSLTQLLSVMKSREEERTLLRKELERTREQLHAKLALECSTYTADTMEEGPPDLVQSGDLESIQESLTENDAN